MGQGVLVDHHAIQDSSVRARRPLTEAHTHTDVTVGMSEPENAPKKVLVIDDDDQYLTLTARLLRGAGYDVVTRSESLGTCATVTAVQPDMVILDVSMPSLDGDRLAHLIQRCTGVETIVVLYSGMEATAFERRAQACGAHASIPKGLLPAQFLERVARVFARTPRPPARKEEPGGGG